MIKNFNGTFETESYCYSHTGLCVLTIWSYKVKIVDVAIDIYCKDIPNRILHDDLDMNYYSNTTRRHQGLARAIRSFFLSGRFNEMQHRLNHCKSLKDIREEFGYISVKE